MAQQRLPPDAIFPPSCISSNVRYSDTHCVSSNRFARMINSDSTQRFTATHATRRDTETAPPVCSPEEGEAEEDCDEEAEAEETAAEGLA